MGGGNPNHDPKTGEFTSGPAGSGSSNAGGGNRETADKIVHEHTVGSRLRSGLNAADVLLRGSGANARAVAEFPRLVHGVDVTGKVLRTAGYAVQGAIVTAVIAKAAHSAYQKHQFDPLDKRANRDFRGKVLEARPGIISDEMNQNRRNEHYVKDLQNRRQAATREGKMAAASLSAQAAKSASARNLDTSRKAAMLMRKALDPSVGQSERESLINAARRLGGKS